MPFFKKLFGGDTSPPAPEPEEYEGFNIYPKPVHEGGSYRLAARIEKDLGGQIKTHDLIRADTFRTADAAADAAVTKAKLLIDQMGERLLD